MNRTTSLPAIVLIWAALTFLGCGSDVDDAPHAYKIEKLQGNVHFQFIDLEFDFFEMTCSDKEFVTNIVSPNADEFDKFCAYWEKLIRRVESYGIQPMDPWGGAPPNPLGRVWVLDQNGERQRVAVLRKIKNEVWKRSPWDLKKEGKTVFVDLDVVWWEKADRYVCQKVNSIQVVDGKISINK